jgi:hypothetical protein
MVVTLSKKGLAWVIVAPGSGRMTIGPLLRWILFSILIAVLTSLVIFLVFVLLRIIVLAGF